jgi:cell division protein FtsB
MLGAREVELDVLRTETWELRRKTTVVVEDGSALVRALESDVARQRATIADLEARNVRLREALAELRDRALLPLP